MSRYPLSIENRLKEVGLTMELSCASALEQYELFKDGDPSGHIRVRWSHFTVDFPDAAGENLCDGSVDGFGGFSDSERENCLLMAISLIERRMGQV